MLPIDSPLAKILTDASAGILDSEYTRFTPEIEARSLRTIPRGFLKG
ncbi:MAG: hypothetical protein IPO98_15720 [Saprospiraceae bacterium]|nr:hypothetical protein [Saprospiraceae bacterium]